MIGLESSTNPRRADSMVADDLFEILAEVLIERDG